MTSEYTRVTVLMGGPDGEREVSLESGEQVAKALQAHDHIHVCRRVIDRPELAELKAIFDEDDAHVVFPVLHGPWGEGGPLQRMLHTIGIPFVGSRHDAAERAMDKMVAKTYAAQCGIPTPIAHEVGSEGQCDLDPPVVVKPTDEGSSLGVRICKSCQEIDEAIAELKGSHSRLMCERFIEGRELTVGILGNDALPIIEIQPTDGFYDYQAKYLCHDTEYLVNPPLDARLAAQIQEWSQVITRAMGVEDLARVDWLLEGENLWFLEVNTIPGMTSHSLLPMAAAELGLDMAALCARAVERVVKRAAASH